MLMADDRSNLWPSEDFALNADDDDLGANLSIDIGTLLDMLGETSDQPQSRSAESLLTDVTTQGLPNLEGVSSSSGDASCSAVFSPSYNLEASDSRIGISDGFAGSAAKSIAVDGARLESSLQLGSPVHSCSGSLDDWMSVQDHDHLYMDKDKVSLSSLLGCKETDNERPNFSEMLSLSAGNSKLTIDNTDGLNFDYPSNGDSFHFTRAEGDYLPEYLSNKQFVEGNKLEAYVVPSMGVSSLREVGVINNRLSEDTSQHLSVPYAMDMIDSLYSSTLRQFVPDNCNFRTVCDTDDKMISMRNGVELSAEDACLNNLMVPQDQTGRVNKGVLEAQIPGSMGVRGLNFRNDVLSGGVSFPKFSDMLVMKQEYYKKDEKNRHLIQSQDIARQSVHDVVGRKLPGGDGGSNQSCSGYWVSSVHQKPEVFAEEEKKVVHESKRPRIGIDDYSRTASGTSTSAAHNCHMDVGYAEPSILMPLSSIKKPFDCKKVEIESKANVLNVNGSNISNINGKKIQRYSLSPEDNVNEDADLCILEDISAPAHPSIAAHNGKSFVPSQHTVIYDSFNSMGVGHTRHKANDERFVFRAALQDLCQPKSEDSPPDGVLAVSLLRHQRIALSWMVKKEKDVSHCSGGILADDQGLGKTISTIALILTERSPSSTDSNMIKSEPETLNLDEDDDGASDAGKLNQGVVPCQLSGSFCRVKNTSVQGKRKPAAGTLIVCPTSVLRQWAEELQNKVTSKANLSVLVYHGSNRTRNPSELAKYDVVLTTYSIVSMEVPKQPLVDEDDDERKCTSDSPMKLSSCKKRQYPPSSSKKSSKGKKGLEDDLLESLGRPLACVRWFRVVLDEAQSIKNHRTQVARACWGLRAKRRWCLSGTPIQNAIDDLYSYFRFLRYDPYSGYASFCTGLKGPINRNPANGYKKLQAVLKTIMLRRTKGTFLDGEPIITLPPKTIKLKKVDFTKEERDFYCRLEADSRAQFAEYAAAGTVKQNYVNILLMLLRLRQACDHPLLVRRSTSSSRPISSIEMVKKLPRDKQIHLLNCLEASLAICGICSDPPEDAVVTSCGHVFCNQCISEHLTGDDTHCPTTNCKALLSASHVFSVATIRSSLCDRPTAENSFDFSVELPEAAEPFSSGCSYESSKIKAALEVLQSLNKQPDDCSRMSCLSSVEEGTCLAENAVNLHSEGSSENLHSDEKGGVGEVSGYSVAKVGEKAIVFSQWTRMLDLLEACLKNSSIQYRRLDGTMSVVARDKAVKDFNTIPEVSVMIMSLKAASLGLNMVAACHVLLLDLWWNPTTEDQAIDRAHRIGQTRPVTVLRLTVKDTVEDRILALQQKKREMVASAFGEDKTGSSQTRLTVEDLRYLFMEG